MYEALFDVPIEPGREEAMPHARHRGLYGAPVSEHDSLMSGEPRFRPQPALAAKCIDHVARRGAFFRRSGWRSELDRVVAERSAQHDGRGALEEPCALQQAMVHDPRGARQLLEEHLPEPRVRHLCLPCAIGSSQAMRAARQGGSQTCLRGVLADRKSSPPRQDPDCCPRLKADDIFRLPGRGRRGLGAVLSDKLRRRLSGRPVY